MYYFIQTTPRDGDLKTTIPVSEPIPVRTTPTLTPDAVGAYSLNAVLITIGISVGKPLIDKVFLFFNEGARNRAKKEEIALDAQLKQTQLLQQSFNDQQEFFQQMVKDSQTQATAAVVASTAQNTEILSKLASSISIMESRLLSNNDVLSEISEVFKTGKPIKIVVEKVNGSIEIKREEDKPIRGKSKRLPSDNT